MNNFVFLALGTGVGAGIVVNGRLHRGFHDAAGELGNLVIGREFLGEERGGVGNLAALVGGKTIRAKAKEAAGKELSAADALERADDAELGPIADEVVDYVAMTVIAIAAILDPEAIVFGGGTAEAGARLVEPVRARIAGELPAPPALVHAVLGADAQLHGCRLRRPRGSSTPTWRCGRSTGNDRGSARMTGRRRGAVGPGAGTRTRNRGSGESRATTAAIVSSSTTPGRSDGSGDARERAIVTMVEPRPSEAFVTHPVGRSRPFPSRFTVGSGVHHRYLW
jgi:hypothetical protein